MDNDQKWLLVLFDSVMLFAVGILLQAGELLVSIIMLGSKTINKLNLHIGIVRHDPDLLHTPIGGVILMTIARPLYLCGSRYEREIISGWDGSKQK